MSNTDLLRTNFRKGQQFSAKEANIITSSIKIIMKSLLSLGFIDSSGISTRKDNPKKGTSVRKSFVRTPPVAPDGPEDPVEPLECYLDRNGTGEEIIVTCEICGGNSLVDATPRLEEGKLLYITFDNIDSVWRPLFPFQASEDCDCS